jgi:peptide/nickel transport system substrate-binding protein
MNMSVARRARGWLAVSVAVAITASVAIGGAAHAANDAPKGKVAYDKNADLTFAYSVGPPGFDPVRPGHLYTFMSPIYDRLTQINDNLEVEPMLAESWEFAKDGSTLEFKLRTDGTFADGTKIDAAAVKANLDRARSAPYSTHINALKSVTNVTAVNPTTVRLALAPGQGVQLPSVLALNAGMIVNPKAIADPNADLTQGPGAGNESGPYKLESATLSIASGQAQYAQRDDWAKYWDKTAGRIKRMKVIGVATGAQRINAVRAGDVNVGQVTGVDVPQAKQLVDSKELGGNLYTQVTTLQALTMKASRPAMQNLKLRQAIQIAIDKEALSDGLYSGYCSPSSQDYPSQHWAHAAALDKKTQYNQAKAKKLLAESGVANPSLTLVYLPLYQPQAEVAKDQLGQIGINVELIPAPSQAGGPSFANGDFDMSWSQLISIDPGDTLANTYLNSTPPVMPLIPAADQAAFLPLQEKLTDPASTQEQRAKVWGQIATKLYENAYIVPVCNASQVWVHDGSIANMDDILGEWSGLVDFRYLYKPKS